MAHFKIIKTKALIAIIIFLTGVPVYPKLLANTSNEKEPINTATRLVLKERYEEAINYLKIYLRKNRKDHDAWTLLGVSYYHTGLPKRALKILKYAEKKSSNRPYNHYYQGLSFDALENKNLSRRFFEKVALSKSPYADPAAFELAASYYNAKMRLQAKKWTDYYIGRFQSGRYIAKALRMREKISRGNFKASVKGVKKPNLEKALFKHGSLSLMDAPHYWFMEFGGGYVSETGFEPDKVLLTKTRSDQTTSMLLKGGIGLGPYRKNSATIYAGYTYDQKWNAPQERLDLYFEDPGDISYFPFRPDLMQRAHSFYGDLRFSLTNSLYAGVFSKYAHLRLGSLIKGPEEWSIEENLATNSQTTIIPWLGVQWNKQNRSLFYWYLYKDIDLESTELSFKTYSLDIDPFPVSMGFNHSIDIASLSTTFNFELYKYEFIYNDPFKDHTRIGALASVTHELIPTLDIEITGGYYKDTYIEPFVKTKQCSLIEGALNQGNAPSTTTDDPVVKCSREDTGFLISGQVSWGYRQFYRVFAKFKYLQNINEDLKQNDFEQQSFLGGITLAFPSVKRTVRYSERFSDRGLERGLRP